MPRAWRFILGTLAGSPLFAGLKNLIADFKQDIAISWLPVRDQRDIFCSVNEFAQSTNDLSEELAVLNHRPTEGFIRGCGLITFNDDLKELGSQRIEQAGAPV
jgi:hypothetical protein